MLLFAAQSGISWSNVDPTGISQSAATVAQEAAAQAGAADAQRKYHDAAAAAKVREAETRIKLSGVRARWTKVSTPSSVKPPKRQRSLGSARSSATATSSPWKQP